MGTFKLEKRNKKTRDLVDANQHLTKEILPSLERTSKHNWPVRKDHCFQRIVLDTICGGVWYAHQDPPAYKNLTHDQAQRAVNLCREIEKGNAEPQRMNDQSLIWRGKKCVPT